MRLNGWQRLWVLFCATYLLAVVTIGYIGFPSWQTVQNFDEMINQLSPDERKLVITGSSSTADYESHGQEIAFPGGHILTVKAEEQDLTVAKAIARVVTIELARERRAYLEKMLILALLPCEIVYTLGCGIAWVRRGFRAA